VEASGYRRRVRAPKPVRVPVIGALVGALLFLVGMTLASAAVAGLGLMLAVWGVLSFTVLVVSRRVRAARGVRIP
jgi:uncharacterized membrane protein YiaA